VTGGGKSSREVNRLHVLLGFAQVERESITKRTRDKITAT
jgi:hypothetical protein